MSKVRDQVTREDQAKINAFGRLNNRMHELETMIRAKKRLGEDLEDASNELMLADDESVRYCVGECLFHVTADEAEQRLGGAADKAKAELEELQEELVGVNSQLSSLKAQLYAKFGNSINLEED